MSLEACSTKRCDDCTCDGKSNGGNAVDIEDVGLDNLRSKEWFNNPEDPGATAGYIERYMNFGLTMPELSEKRRPIIGIAQTGSDLTPCNRHHLELAKRVRDGIIESGGTPFEFPCHPIQETSKRPSATLDRNLLYLGLVEILFGYPFDAVVLLSGCDKTTPALLMAAATVNLPAIVMNVGPMLNGYMKEERAGSGTIVWEMRKRLAAGQINYDQYLEAVCASATSTGHCQTMGTASTMNAMAEALGMALPGSASIPAPYRERGQCAYATGKQIVELVRKDIKPSDILTRGAFLNAIACCTAIGGSTNAPIHLLAIAKHIGVELNNDDWEKYGYSLPLLVNVQPAGEWLCEEYHRAGGLPAVVAELLAHKKLPCPEALTVNLKSIGENCEGKETWDRRVIFPFDKPLKSEAGFLNLKGSLFDSAIMKTSVISDSFREQYLSNPEDPMAFEGPIAVFDGPEDYHRKIELEDNNIKAGTILVMRGAGPKGYPGAAEVANMQPPGRLIKKNIELPCIADARQSGTSYVALISAATEGSMLACLKDGDKVRIDLLKRRADVLLSPEEIAERKKGWKLNQPESQTPWQEIYRKNVTELSEGMVFESATKFQRIAQKHGVPRHNH
ncbi:putative dihydroxy-acid dehydratase [Meredithblackwellia eburnea MCA 4105]